MCEEEYDRTDIAVLTVILEAYPRSMTEEDITKRILELKLLDISEEEFQKYRDSVLQMKSN